MIRESSRAVSGISVRPAGYWRMDTKAIIGGVLFGIVMVLLVQVGDQTDTALTGGAFLIFGGIAWATTMGISTLLFRQPAGIIAGLMQGIMSIATGGSPLAITFPVVNVAGSLAYSLVAWKLPMSSWAQHLLAQVAGNVVGNLLVAIGLYYILNLPLDVILVSTAVTLIVSILVGTVLTKMVADGVVRSGVLD